MPPCIGFAKLSLLALCAQTRVLQEGKSLRISICTVTRASESLANSVSLKNSLSFSGICTATKSTVEAAAVTNFGGGGEEQQASKGEWRELLFAAGGRG